MLISVIVTTKNEERNIENCLRSVREQRYPSELIEIVVVDNGSTDQTKGLAGRYANVVMDRGPERSMQRNCGVEASRGDYFLYLDADMILSPEVVSECVEIVRRDPSVVGLYIPEIIMGESYFSRVRRFERSFYNATPIDCVRFVQRKVFLEAEGFDETLTGPEDWDLDKKLRMRGRTCLISSPLYHNEAEFDLGRYLSKKGYYARSFDAYIAKWGRDDPDVRRQFGLWYRYLGVFWENGKWRRLLSSPGLAAGMYFLRFRVGVNFLLRGGKQA